MIYTEYSNVGGIGRRREWTTHNLCRYCKSPGYTKCKNCGSKEFVEVKEILFDNFPTDEELRIDQVVKRLLAFGLVAGVVWLVIHNLRSL